MIATATIGMDQFDLPWCAEHGIATFNSPGCNSPAVAQYVWSSLLHIGIDPKDITIGVAGARQRRLHSGQLGTETRSKGAAVRPTQGALRSRR